MEFDQKEMLLGKIWFFGAGFFAICLSLFLALADFTLTTSDSEQVKGDEIREVRLAASSLAGSQVDPRLTADSSTPDSDESNYEHNSDKDH